MTADGTIAVVLADDHPLPRDALALLGGRRPDMRVAGTAGTGDEAIGLARADVLCLDLSMPGGGV